MLVGAYLGSMALQASTWRVARTRTMRASSERIREVLSDVRAFGSCCAPAEARARPGAASFSTPSRGVGAWLEWSSPGGRERGTIESVGASRVVTRYDIRGSGSRQVVTWRSAGARGTEVTWAIEGDKSSFTQRLVWPFARLDSRLGGSIETALTNLDRATR